MKSKQIEFDYVILTKVGTIHVLYSDNMLSISAWNTIQRDASWQTFVTMSNATSIWRPSTSSYRTSKSPNAIKYS